jgi:glucose-1-phosphate cytidylyltransferase
LLDRFAWSKERETSERGAHSVMPMRGEVMKAVILAGGLGTRLGEETQTRPKPMIEIGSMPILWHIMKIYAAHDVRDFVVCCGYRGYLIKEFFHNYFLHHSDVTFDLAKNEMQIHQNAAEDWRVTLIDTGERTQTGGRLKRVRTLVEKDAAFCFTYGDGVGDIDITKLIAFHRTSGIPATVTAVQPPGRFGALDLNNEMVRGFAEKPQGDGSWISGGFFVLSPKIFDFIEGDESIWERQPLETLAAQGHLNAYKHSGFWHAMDSARDKTVLNELWNSNQAPWKVWK